MCVLMRAYCVRDSSQRVFAKFRIIKMNTKVLQRQAKSRCGVLEVVHEECRHGLERLQFLGQHQLLRQSKVRQARRDLVPDALE